MADSRFKYLKYKKKYLDLKKKIIPTNEWWKR